jgi:hypothetical protein
MPSQLHEALLLLFRNRPTLAPELMRDALHFELPEFTEARIDSADLTEVKPAEYRADLVVLLLDGVPGARHRHRGAAVARSTQEIRVAGLRDEPARADPELAVFSAIAHGRDKDTSKAAQIALAAQLGTLVLDVERGGMYFDLVFDSLSEAAQKELRAMDPAKYQYRSEFARRYFGQGLSEGLAKGELHGRAALLQRLLTRRFGALPAEATRAPVRRHDRRARRHRRAPAQRTDARRSARLPLSPSPP